MEKVRYSDGQFAKSGQSGDLRGVFERFPHKHIVVTADAVTLLIPAVDMSSDPFGIVPVEKVRSEDDRPSGKTDIFREKTFSA
jgi:hypothetical protein